MAATPETYTRTIHTMSEILDSLRHEPDPDGALTVLADQIAVEQEWVRVLTARAGVGPSSHGSRWRAGHPAGSVLAMS